MAARNPALPPPSTSSFWIGESFQSCVNFISMRNLQAIVSLSDELHDAIAGRHPLCRRAACSAAEQHIVGLLNRKSFVGIPAPVFDDHRPLRHFIGRGFPWILPGNVLADE